MVRIKQRLLQRLVLNYDKMLEQVLEENDEAKAAIVQGLHKERSRWQAKKKRIKQEKAELELELERMHCRHEDKAAFATRLDEKCVKQTALIEKLEGLIEGMRAKNYVSAQELQHTEEQLERFR